MDDEHLKDFYAGLAMMGVLSQGHNPAYVRDTVMTAWDLAEAMMAEREERRERDEKRNAER